MDKNIKSYEFYAYSWHIDEEYEDETYIRIYGFNDLNENVCVSINGFRPFVWVELPKNINWKIHQNINLLTNYFQKLFPEIRCNLKFRRKLYGANLKLKNDNYEHKMYPFLLCSFLSFKDAKFNLVNRLRSKQKIDGLGYLKFNVHGQDACPRLQLTSKYDLPTTGWIKFKGVEIVKEEDKFTFGTREYMVNLSSQSKELICRLNKTTIPKPLILSFDLEVNSEDTISMPKASKPGDVIFQISCVFSKLGSFEYDKYLLSLGHPKEDIVGSKILTYSTEKKLLMGFRDLINKLNPNVIIGYNIFNFDIPYLMDRARYKSIFLEWAQQGFAKDKPGIQREIKWSSSAYKNQEFKFLDCEGRLYIDLLPVVQRDFKLNDYKLKTVSTHFIGETKDDLDPKSIFLCYREGIKDDSEKASKYMSICGKYCIQDSMLVIKLFETLNVWYGLSEMANVCNVPMIILFTKGQQIKVYSQLYKYCLENKIVPEKDGYITSENERYVGAYVFAPKPGLYKNVVPFDFCIDGETLISTSSGTSVRMKNITNRKVYGCNEEHKIDSYQMNGELQQKGLKKTIKIILQDGREIIATPDHKFMLEDGSWCEAQNLLNKKVKCGIEQPEDIICFKELNWILDVEEYIFNFNSFEERMKTLAFARILGYVLRKNTSSEVYFETMFDANNFIEDLKLVLLGLKKYNNIGCRQRTTSKGTCIYVTIPNIVTKMFVSLVGKRSSQATKLPNFLMDNSCPKSVIREFLGGLFGGDGTAPHMSKNRIYPMSFKWDTSQTDLVKVFETLKKLILQFDINTIVHKSKDEEDNHRVSCVLSFSIDDIYKFQDRVGFRYCINKSNKLYVVSSYQKFQNKVREHYRGADRSSLSAKKFIQFSEYIEQIGAKEWFATATTVKSEDTTSPTLNFLVKYVISNDVREVYDIEVSQIHNFIGNGVCLHNCSLYPSLIISYNIDYTTCAFDPSIPDEICHIMEWEDHISCKHDPKIIEKERLTKTIDELTSKKNYDKTLVSQLRKQRSDITKSLNKNVMCEKRKYRFLKSGENSKFKGVLPTIIQSLLNARQETRKQMNKLKDNLKNISDKNDRIETEINISILNQRQLAYKISANSMYGITGVKSGILPFMPAAMSITYMGRTNIMKVADIIQSDYNGQIVAGDTDSTYVSFNHKKFTPQELWDHAVKIASEVSKHFPPPMKLEFEEAIYIKFLILTKKRYMYQSALRDGTIKPEIGKRGVLLNRRDNSTFIRNIYENIVKIIFNNDDDVKVLKDKVISSLLDDLNKMFSYQLPTDHFVITKSTGDYGNLVPQYFLNDKGVHRAMLGQYNVPFLTEEIKDLEKIETPQQEKDWYLDKLPAHIQLLEKIKRRNQTRNEGSRLEYVIVETDDLKDKQSAKIETLNYYNKNKDILNLDYLYYLNRCINPIDQILEVIFNLKDFMKNHYNQRLLKKKLTIQLNNLFSPKIEIEMDKLYLVKENSKYQILYEYQGSYLGEKTNILLETDYAPIYGYEFYDFLKSKYGSKSSLKTKFIFIDNYILLGDMTESKLISTIKKECKKVHVYG